MKEKSLREWKKVFESDLGYIAYELKDMIDTPSVIILKGEMGAGKTTFVKKFVETHEQSAGTMSPSYSVLSETPNILHGDFYRIEDKEEILHLELELYLEEKQFFLVEWGDKYIHTLYKETPEEYNFYRLNIHINDRDQSSDKAQSRNFSLESLTEID